MTQKFRNDLVKAVEAADIPPAELSMNEYHLLQVLAVFATDIPTLCPIGQRKVPLQPRQACPGRDKLAFKCRCSPELIDKLVLRLERQGWLIVSRPADRGEPSGRGHVTIYTVNDPAARAATLARVGLSEAQKGDTCRPSKEAQKGDSRRPSSALQKGDGDSEKGDGGSQKGDGVQPANGRISAAGRQNSAAPGADRMRTLITGDENTGDAPAPSAWAAPPFASLTPAQGPPRAREETPPRPRPTLHVVPPGAAPADGLDEMLGAESSAAGKRRRKDGGDDSDDPLHDPTPWLAGADRHRPAVPRSFYTCPQCAQERPSAEFGQRTIQGVLHFECRERYGGCGVRLPQARFRRREVTEEERQRAARQVAPPRVGALVERIAGAGVGRRGQVVTVYEHNGYLMVDWDTPYGRQESLVRAPWTAYVRVVEEARVG